jgi:4'-phosphopantetheinyl transferase
VQPIDNRVAVYVAHARLLDTSGNNTAFLSYLSPPDRLYIKSIKSCKCYREFVLSRVLAGTALRAWSKAAGSEWRIINEPNGRPRVLALDPGITAPSISLSHSADLVVCALAESGDIGIDVEQVRPRDVANMVLEVCSERERNWLERQPAAERLRAFYQLWTLKEAHVKALGIGLATPLRNISFDIFANDVQLSPEPGIDTEMPATWYLSFIPQTGVVGSLALLGTRHPHPHVRFHIMRTPGRLADIEATDAKDLIELTW